MPKGYLKNPHWVQVECQYCGKKFDYYKETSRPRKACHTCLPEGTEQDAARIRRLIKKKAVDLKGRRCEICGLVEDYCVYDFHHKDPNEKDFSLGDKKSTLVWSKVKEEVDKCMLVCSNCHRKIHHSHI